MSKEIQKKKTKAFIILPKRRVKLGEKGSWWGRQALNQLTKTRTEKRVNSPFRLTPSQVENTQI